MLQVRVAGAEHRVETRNLQLAAAAFAGLFVMTMTSHFAKNAFTIHLLLEAPERLLNRLAFLEFDLGHADSLPFRTLAGNPAPMHGDATATQVKMEEQPTWVPLAVSTRQKSQPGGLARALFDRMGKCW